MNEFNVVELRSREGLTPEQKEIIEMEEKLKNYFLYLMEEARAKHGTKNNMVTHICHNALMNFTAKSIGSLMMAVEEDGIQKEIREGSLIIFNGVIDEIFRQEEEEKNASRKH